MNCFNCGKPLNLNSIQCPHCGFMPDIEFARKCPNLRSGICTITNVMCNFMGQYQTCPTKNKADSECGY